MQHYQRSKLSFKYFKGVDERKTRLQQRTPSKEGVSFFFPLHLLVFSSFFFFTIQVVYEMH